MKKRIAIPIVFFGSEEASVIILKKVLSLSSLKTTLVITKPPRPAGRNQILTPTPVGQFAKNNSLPLLTPQELNHQLCQKIAQTKPEVAVLAAYGQIVPQELINVFPKGIINVHPSLLPKLRGATPVASAILGGKKTTGVSLFLIDKKVDHGPIIAQEKTLIKNNDTQESLTEKLFCLGARLLEKKLFDYLEEKITPQPQEHQKASFTKLLSRQDGYIEPNHLKRALLGDQGLADKIDRKIRAFFSWPGTFTFVKNQRLKIIKAHQEDNCLRLDLVQLSGGKPIPWNKDLAKSFLLPWS